MPRQWKVSPELEKACGEMRRRFLEFKTPWEYAQMRRVEFFSESLPLYAKGRFAEAERLLQRYIDDSKHPVINFRNAAEEELRKAAASLRKEYDRKGY